MAIRKDSSGVEEQQKQDRVDRLEIYKLLVEMADRVSQRRQAANSFYLTINTLLVGGNAYFGSKAPSCFAVILVSIVGISICWYWIMAIRSYKTLNEAKFSVINDLEVDMTVKPYTVEWKRLDPDGDGIRHKPFHEVERAIPKVFIAMYILLALSSISWNSLIRQLLVPIC